MKSLCMAEVASPPSPDDTKGRLIGAGQLRSVGRSARVVDTGQALHLLLSRPKPIIDPSGVGPDATVPPEWHSWLFPNFGKRYGFGEPDAMVCVGKAALSALDFEPLPHQRFWRVAWEADLKDPIIALLGSDPRAGGGFISR